MKDDEVFEKIYPLITPDDISNNRKSLYRKLTESLYLIVKKPRQQHSWQFPQGGRDEKDGFSLRKTAERELKEECGKTLNVHFSGMAPSHYFCYNHSPQEKAKLNTDGSKVFFFKALYVGGHITLEQKELVDYLWVTRDEMKEYFSEDLFKVSDQFLSKRFF